MSGNIVGSGANGAEVTLFGRVFPYTDPLTQFGSRRLGSRCEVSGYVTGNACLDFVQHGHTGADLTWCAVAALIPIMLHESGLHRV